MNIVRHLVTVVASAALAAAFLFTAQKCIPPSDARREAAIKDGALAIQSQILSLTPRIAKAAATDELARLSFLEDCREGNRNGQEAIALLDKAVEHDDADSAAGRWFHARVDHRFLAAQADRLADLAWSLRAGEIGQAGPAAVPPELNKSDPAFLRAVVDALRGEIQRDAPSLAAGVRYKFTLGRMVALEERFQRVDRQSREGLARLSAEYQQACNNLRTLSNAAKQEASSLPSGSRKETGQQHANVPRASHGTPAAEDIREPVRRAQRLLEGLTSYHRRDGIRALLESLPTDLNASEIALLAGTETTFRPDILEMLVKRTRPGWLGAITPTQAAAMLGPASDYYRAKCLECLGPLLPKPLSDAPVDSVLGEVPGV
jgi:hypothetical protein